LTSSTTTAPTRRSTPSGRNTFGRISHRTLVVWGQNDVHLSRKSGALPFKNAYATSTSTCSDTGHFALEDHSEEIAAHIKRFALTISGSDAAA